MSWFSCHHLKLHNQMSESINKATSFNSVEAVYKDRGILGLKDGDWDLRASNRS